MVTTNCTKRRKLPNRCSAFIILYYSKNPEFSRWDFTRMPLFKNENLNFKCILFLHGYWNKPVLSLSHQCGTIAFYIQLVSFNFYSSIGVSWTKATYTIYRLINFQKFTITSSFFPFWNKKMSVIGYPRWSLFAWQRVAGKMESLEIIECEFLFSWKDWWFSSWPEYKKRNTGVLITSASIRGGIKPITFWHLQDMS